MEHLPFFEYFFPTIRIVSFILGIFGVFIIIIGSIKSAWEYIKNTNDSFQKIRLIFSQHLIIGLDFFVGKDIIDTMLIHTGENFWEEVTIIIIVVIIRIVLTIMAERELLVFKENK
ncbi:TPA: DUF1622 domain-containing protein [Candidatus Gracilibacteria bacterium]|nr:DUF1622 domain-containing protein [Candidatus Gracilibacteria bacterium]